MKIDSDNWTSSYYQTDKLRSFVCLSAAPAHESEPQLIYSLTVTDHEHKEIMQSDYNSLDDALAQLNNRYGAWELIIPGVKSSSDGGCGSCSAH
jgi:hypothetical protein